MKKIDISKYADSILTTIDKIGKLSRLYRILIFLGIFAILVGPFIWFIYLPKMEKIEALEKEQQALDSRLLRANAKKRQLRHLQNEMKKAQAEFKMVKKKLPEQKEIPTLLANVSRSGHEAGLEFLLFQPGPEQRKDFYAEIPVSVQVSGKYHDVALFFDKVSRLSRIVNIDNIRMGGFTTNSLLDTSCTAITYRFVEAQPPPAKK
ncbi:MAG: type 4a pilus biogenesis protein PilO [Desulfobacterales bacterium]|nr:MAG: type 4a pilus biogenesis protein PilO [Desulfobacterales bacterium]